MAPRPTNLGAMPILLRPAASTARPLAQFARAAPPQFIRGIKSTNTPRPDRFAYSATTPALTSTSTAALERKAHSTPLRTGLLAQKRGMTALYDSETGTRVPATVLQIDRNEVVAHKTRDANGYWAVQIGAGSKEARNVTKPMLGHFAKAEVSPKRWVAEFKVKGSEGLGVKVGQAIGAEWFSVGQWVDIKGISRGMGFAGGMKRHGFGGQPASHGVSLTHRSMGSAGGGQGSGSRVLPGKRMAGNMGNESVTVTNLKVMMVDAANGIVVVKGAVPGHKGNMVRVQDAKAKDWPEGPMVVEDVSVPEAEGKEVVA